MITRQDITSSQAIALSQIEAYIADPDRRMFGMAGFAGTGKTSLLCLLAQEHPMTLVAPTGKAASVFSAKSGQKALTIHGLKWKLIETEKDKHGRKILVFESVSRDFRGRIIAVDEASMLNTELGKDLMMTGAKLILIGDPMQLRPVKGEPFYDFNNADFTLTEVHRQALESAVLRQVTNWRENGVYESDGPDFRTVRALREDDLCAADVVICFRNKTRHRINQKIRRMAGRPNYVVEAGELVMALKNCHKLGIYNGGVYQVAEDFDMEGSTTMILEMGDGVVEVPRVGFVPPGGSLDDFDDDQHLNTVFDHGYCLTAHKAQGSEWQHVALIDEYHRPEYRREWVYTAISRASKSLVVAR